MSWPSKVFEFNPAAVNWLRGVVILDVMLVPLLAKRAPAAKQRVPAGQAG